jgi:diacylglycerol kinase (ATP)
MRHSLWQSFEYAGRGLRDAVWSQRTMRIHVLLAATVVALVAWLDVPVGGTAILVLAMAAVLATELLNTAVETVVDMQVGNRHHDLAGRAKDLSAAAVLVTAAGAALAGLLILGPPIVAAIGLGRIDGLLLGRGGALLAVLALAVIVLRRVGERPVFRESLAASGRPHAGGVARKTR